MNHGHGSISVSDAASEADEACAAHGDARATRAACAVRTRRGGRGRRVERSRCLGAIHANRRRRGRERGLLALAGGPRRAARSRRRQGRRIPSVLRRIRDRPLVGADRGPLRRRRAPGGIAGPGRHPGSRPGRTAPRCQGDPRARGVSLRDRRERHRPAAPRPRGGSGGGRAAHRGADRSRRDAGHLGNGDRLGTAASPGMQIRYEAGDSPVPPARRGQGPFRGRPDRRAGEAVRRAHLQADGSEAAAGWGRDVPRRLSPCGHRRAHRVRGAQPGWEGFVPGRQRRTAGGA